ncbi:unnamed protein product [Miscanthus lutarioriparius]|uniref:RWP-RK domain-containing protein n=1 Tax=Miscanthus lutarioriparius TaxID=422564 RepID=A0A811PWL2_9POAL|nr:unnamed protein product [Miscanthus lutarioriparius]
MAGGKRNRLQGAPPKWAIVRGMLHMRLKDAATELNVPITYLRRLCHQNGFPNWPGKRIRYMNGIGRNPMLEVDAPESSSRRAGLAGPSQLAKVAETKKKEEEATT